MSKILNSTGFVLLVGMLSVLAAPASASRVDYPFVDGSLDGYALTTAGGVVNPEVLVGFNPQPDPPGFGDDGHEVEFVVPGSSDFQFAMAFVLGNNSGELPDLDVPNSDGRTTESFMLDGNSFVVTLAFSDPGSITDWSAFNPQPDPPGLWFGASFDPDAQIVSFEITENGTPLTFAAVPEPGTLSLLGIALLALGGLTLRRKFV